MERLLGLSAGKSAAESRGMEDCLCVFFDQINRGAILEDRKVKFFEIFKKRTFQGSIYVLPDLGDTVGFPFLADLSLEALSIFQPPSDRNTGTTRGNEHVTSGYPAELVKRGRALK